MSKNNAPTIEDAKQLATKCRRRGVIILAFNRDGYAAASYGMTRADCAAMRKVLDQIGEKLSGGDIEVPPVPETGRPDTPETPATPAGVFARVTPPEIVAALEVGLRLAEIAVRQGLHFDPATTEEIVRNHVSLVQIRAAVAKAKGQ